MAIVMAIVLAYKRSIPSPSLLLFLHRPDKPPNPKTVLTTQLFAKTSVMEAAISSRPLSLHSLRCVARRLLADVPQTSRYVHSTCAKAAVAHTANVSGPPPKPPTPTPGYRERLERRKRQAEQIRQGNEASAQSTQGPGAAKLNPLKRRFWKDVHVTGEEGELGEIFLHWVERNTVSLRIQANH